MADGKPALAGQICEPDLPVQVFLQKLSHSTLLPRYESTATCLRCNERRSIPLRYMSAKQEDGSDRERAPKTPVERLETATSSVS